MNRGLPVKYLPVPQEHSPYLALVPLQSSQGVGVEAVKVAQLMEKLTASINRTEMLFLHFEEEVTSVAYNHVEARCVGTLKVRYRNEGRLQPRQVPIDDE